MNDSVNFGLPRWKRVLDVATILMALPLLLPVAIAIGTIIRMVSPGPILFKQERIGFRGRRFMCLKFRTMRCGAETATHQGHLQQLMDANVPMIKMDATGDARIIPLGRLLRSSGLDELPQLINVLKGEMSLVGPRPCLAYEAAKYQAWQMERFNAVPGLTGLWQVSGKNRTTFTRMMQLDIEYSRTKSLGLDLKIIFKTVPALLIQMWDTRMQRKLVSPNAEAAQTPLPLRVANQ
jgi:lipopolysaccharide/colanic/teichoic acid biosynthesis glycosyltransferase